MYPIKQSQTTQALMFPMFDSADGTTPKTGLTPTVTLSKNGGTFAAPAGTVTEVGSGWYKVAGNATDSGTLGPLILHATATGASVTDVTYEVVAYDPLAAADLGLSTLAAVPNANANADALLDRANSIETGLTLRSALQAIAAVCFGKGPGSVAGTAAYRAAVADHKARVTATVTPSLGDRTAITTDFT